MSERDHTHCAVEGRHTIVDSGSSAQPCHHHHHRHDGRTSLSSPLPSPSLLMVERLTALTSQAKTRL